MASGLSPSRNSLPATATIIHVEVMQQNTSKWEPHLIQKDIERLLEHKTLFPTDNCKIEVPKSLQNHVAEIRLVVDESTEQTSVCAGRSSLQYHVYRLEGDGPEVEELEGGDEPSPAASHWLLPCTDLHGLWETLVYDTNVKQQLLQYVDTALLFSDHCVDSNIISWNKVVLLHGPPGTGKTSLCKALAQKLSVRLSERYSYCQLVEINSHSLFSKYFSESGKLVEKLFRRLQELVEDRQNLLIVLIDEVESLARSRNAVSSAEPSDAIRVVNALLTQLDAIRRYPNVLIMTTSNLSESVDVAFIDRADLRLHIALPSQLAIYQIYHSCITELGKTGLLQDYEPCMLLTQPQIKLLGGAINSVTEHSHDLWDIAKGSSGLSGRSLRKLPFLAHALHVRQRPATLPHFLQALKLAVAEHKRQAQLLQ